MLLYTTLNKIRSKNPCTSGWVKLLKYLNKTQADDEQLSFKTILESNGLDDAIWCLISVENFDKEIRLFAVACARIVEHLDKTGQAKKTNDVAERFANGLCTTDDLDAARDAAWAAATAAARDAEWAAARDAARAAARAAEWDAAWAAARAAAWAAARDAAWAAARAAAREDAARARDAARAAARAAVWAAARDANNHLFIKMFCAD